MPWFQVDDQLPVHKKVIAAGNAAMGLWVRAGSWSQQNLTGGFIPTQIVKALGTIGQAKSLVNAGLWDAVKGGYRFHDWDKHQLSVEEQEERRRKRAEAGRKGGQASGASRRGEANAEASASPNASRNVDQNVEQKRTPVLVPGPLVVTKEGGVTEGDDPEPPRYCKDHPNDTTDYCRPCIVLRKNHDAWKKRIKARESDELESKRQQKTVAAQRLRDCRLCDEHGWTVDETGATTPDSRKCTHVIPEEAQHA